ncbi:MAG: YggS family pyridoxal phosphate-dependent enzyme [Pseudomonadota bacterium]
MALEDVRKRIREAERRAERREGSVELVAVSKVQPEERIVSVLDAGHRRFGENRVQEAQGRWPDLMARYEGIALHLIGPLQSNKVKAAVELFDVIESLDREKLAAKLASEMAAQGKRVKLFVQVNTGEEAQKAGVAPSEVEAFVSMCRDRHGLEIAGVMAIPPAEDPPSAHFELLRALAERCGVEELSMGMSADFETAIALGATSVRVGSGVFGDRVYDQG